MRGSSITDTVSSSTGQMFLIGDVGGTNTRLQLHAWDPNTDKDSQSHTDPQHCRIAPPSSTHPTTPPGLTSGIPHVFLSVVAVKLADKTYPSKKYSTLTDAIKEFLDTVSNTPPPHPTPTNALPTL